MLLPNRENAYIPLEKLSDYLLSETHVSGKTKAAFFDAHGYSRDRVRILERDLLDIARTGDVCEEVVTPHGTKYIVDGGLKAPRGTVIIVRTVWIVEREDERPRFVTAYPHRSRSDD